MGSQQSDTRRAETSPRTVSLMLLSVDQSQRAYASTTFAIIEIVATQIT